jgi:D-alanyl-D-alanine carboxypeptidase (penicillin-binding protein 5/6)
MKKSKICFIGLIFLCILTNLFIISDKNTFLSAKADSFTTGCKSAYLMDSYSKECIYSENETKRLPIASVCKVMTITLCFEAIENGKLSLDDEILVSGNAAGMGGSQVYLQSGLKYKLSDLIKSAIVCSANDSCVAISEAVCGSEDVFVCKMNEKAHEIGCNDTLFVNCTGLPKEGQYSCAKDVAVMFANLINYPEYFTFSKIWLEDFAHPDNRITTITNTNKLLKRYSYCDGGKTGFTNDAGFCLTATAIKDNLRLISVVLGADSSDNRFSSTINLFNYGFSNYKNAIILDENVNLNDKFNVKNGKKLDIYVRPERKGMVFTKNGEMPEITFDIRQDKLIAPIEKDSVVGSIDIYRNGIIYDTIQLVASETIEKASYADYLKMVANGWAI